MAGSINLSLSQQFDKLNGNLLSGGRLYFYAAGTDSPQNAFKDTGLVLPHPNPIILTSDGRIPQLYFADGSIHVRLTSAGGVVQFDEDFVLVIGPSSGGGGGGGGGSSVDPNAIFQTGDIMWQPVSGDRSGWVMCNGNTIGNGSSGATYHDAGCQALFEYLYNKYPQSICPVSSGRPLGETSFTAWSGAFRLTLLDFREMAIGGLSTMGGPGDRGGFAALAPERGDRNTAASIVGEIIHQLTEVEVPVHNHVSDHIPAVLRLTTDSNSNGHAHQVPGPVGTSGSATGQSTTGGAFWNGGIGGSLITSGDESVPHTHTFTNTAFGGGNYHNNTSRMMLGTFYMRL
jgi:hypothetical protein